VSDVANYAIRDYRREDHEFLRDMSYEAAFWQPDAGRPPGRMGRGWGPPGTA
jgi:hypothetical protein